GVEQRRHAAGGDGGLAGHVAGAAGNAAGYPVLVNRAGLLRLARRRRVVVDGDDQGIGGGRHPVLVEGGGAQDRAGGDGEGGLGVVTGQAVEAGMVERVDQGEGPGAGGAVEREGEHRVRTRRGGQRVANHRVGDGDAARGQRRQAAGVGVQAEGQRLGGAGVEQRRYPAGGDGGLAGRGARAAGDPPGSP